MSEEEEFIDDTWEIQASRYRCCCGCVHLTRASSLVGIADVLILSLTFARGIHLYLSVKTNPVVTAWFVASTMIFTLEIIVIVALWYGTWAEKSLWLLPKLVLKMFTIAFASLAILGLSYLVMEGSRIIIDLVASEMSLDYYSARQVVRIGGILLICAGCLFVCLELWFLVVLYDCYRYIKRRELSNKSREIREKLIESGANVLPANSNNFPQILIQKLDPEFDLRCNCNKELPASSAPEFSVVVNSCDGCNVDSDPPSVHVSEHTEVEPVSPRYLSPKVWKYSRV